MRILALAVVAAYVGLAAAPAGAHRHHRHHRHRSAAMVWVSAHPPAARAPAPAPASPVAPPDGPVEEWAEVSASPAEIESWVAEDRQAEAEGWVCAGPPDYSCQLEGGA